MQPVFDASAARRIGAAVQELESRSSAELIVEIRARSGSYAHADARFGACVALVSLIVVVFMPFVVPPITVVLDPIAFYAVALLTARRSDSIRRLFTTRRERLEAVRTHAAALFHDRGVANTSGETGVVLFASVLERRLEVVADRGILQSVEPYDWNAALAELHVERKVDAERVIAAIQQIGTVLQRDLPAEALDRDELPNAPEVQLA